MMRFTFQKVTVVTKPSDIGQDTQEGMERETQTGWEIQSTPREIT